MACLFTCPPLLLSAKVGSLLEALGALILKDKAWVSAALDHLRKTLSEPSAGGRLPVAEGGVAVAPEQRKQLFAFDLGKTVKLELVPSVQQLAELFVCSQGEEVRGERGG